MRLGRKPQEDDDDRWPTSLTERERTDYIVIRLVHKPQANRQALTIIRRGLHRAARDYADYVSEVDIVLRGDRALEYGTGKDVTEDYAVLEHMVTDSLSRSRRAVDRIRGRGGSR